MTAPTPPCSLDCSPRRAIPSSARLMREPPGRTTRSIWPYAIGHNLILVTKDPDDFQLLHEQNSNHPGICGIYQDNNPARDMSPVDIVAAIARIEEAVPLGYPIQGNFHVLNDWR